LDTLAQVVGLNREQLLAYLQTGGLGFARILTAIGLVPFLGGKLVRMQIKMSIATAIFLLLAPAIISDPGVPPPALEAFLFTFLLLKEILIGFVIGFTAGLVFHAVEASGRFLDLARGASMAQIYTPQLGAQVSLFGQLNVQLTIVVFFLLDGHHFFLRAFGRSFQLLPVGTFPTFAPGLSPLAEHFIHVTSGLFVVALQLAAPAAAATFITDIFLGIANKVSPQIQVFFLGMPLKAMLGILMMFIVLALWKTEVSRAIAGGMEEMVRAIHLLI
jgi:flagellar biosynthetic protein FliR